MNKSELAINLHDKGYNCAQSVACAFAKELNIPEAELFSIMEGFGFGMGSSNLTCGALSGAVALAGIKNSDKNLSSPSTKRNTYALAAKITEIFEEKAKSTVCREIKGMNSGKILCSCADCIKIGVEAVEEVLKI